MTSLSPAVVGIAEAASARPKPSSPPLGGSRLRRPPAPLRPIFATLGSSESKACLRSWGRRQGAAGSRSAVAERWGEESGSGEEGSMSIDLLRRFFDLNIGKWNGSFYQFDAHGNLLQNVVTRLAASSCGEGDLISLIQALYIKQPPSRMFVSVNDDEAEWVEYKVKETNMFTADQYQQIGFFPNEKAFSLRYQTAGMLEAVLRAGVLGEDDTGEECPRNLKLPSCHPSVVCESCLHSMERDMRARAFHVMDPKGVLEMLLIFLEERGDDVSLISSGDCLKDDANRLTSFLGCWKGRSVTKRSGVYGATVTEGDTIALLEMDDEGRLIQDITLTMRGSSMTTNVHWTGMVANNLVTFDRGYQMTLLPGGMYMGCPCDIGKSVTQSQSFHVEFCWMESPNRRQRLLRTYDAEGLAVSSTYILETKAQGM